MSFNLTGFMRGFDPNRDVVERWKKDALQKQVRAALQDKPVDVGMDDSALWASDVSPQQQAMLRQQSEGLTRSQFNGQSYDNDFAAQSAATAYNSLPSKMARAGAILSAQDPLQGMQLMASGERMTQEKADRERRMRREDTQDTRQATMDSRATTEWEDKQRSAGLARAYREDANRIAQDAATFGLTPIEQQRQTMQAGLQHGQIDPVQAATAMAALHAKEASDKVYDAGARGWGALQQLGDTMIADGKKAEFKPVAGGMVLYYGGSPVNAQRPFRDPMEAATVLAAMINNDPKSYLDYSKQYDAQAMQNRELGLRAQQLRQQGASQSRPSAQEMLMDLAAKAAGGDQTAARTLAYMGKMDRGTAKQMTPMERLELEDAVRARVQQMNPKMSPAEREMEVQREVATRLGEPSANNEDAAIAAALQKIGGAKPAAQSQGLPAKAPQRGYMDAHRDLLALEARMEEWQDKGMARGPAWQTLLKQKAALESEMSRRKGY